MVSVFAVGGGNVITLEELPPELRGEKVGLDVPPDVSASTTLDDEEKRKF